MMTIETFYRTSTICYAMLEAGMNPISVADASKVIEAGYDSAREILIRLEAAGVAKRLDGRGGYELIGKDAASKIIRLAALIPHMRGSVDGIHKLLKAANVPHPITSREMSIASGLAKKRSDTYLNEMAFYGLVSIRQSTPNGAKRFVITRHGVEALKLLNGLAEVLESWQKQ